MMNHNMDNEEEVDDTKRPSTSVVDPNDVDDHDQRDQSAVVVNDDAASALKLYITEQLVMHYQFTSDVVRQVVEQVVVDIQADDDDEEDEDDDSKTKITTTSIQRYHHGGMMGKRNIQELMNICCTYILENQLDIDRGGPITPKLDCPHLSTATSTLRDNIITMMTSITEDDDHHGVQVAATTTTNYFHPAMAPCSHHDCMSRDENWLCYHCGIVRCSRYINGHNLQHYHDTGHCIVISLQDLSVWCHECQSYLYHPTLKPLLHYLHSMKFPTNHRDDDDNDDTNNNITPSPPDHHQLSNE